MGKLIIVPTPVGNLEDITLRALKVLKAVDLILCEDTRQSKKLLDHYQIQKRLLTYHKFNERASQDNIIEQLRTDKDIALISDCGTPGISDPGMLLIQRCIAEHITIETLPGPTAFVPAVINSGFDTKEFVYMGFLPHKKGRQTKLKQIAAEERTVIVYESPYRVIKLLEELKEFVGANRMVSFSREISKMFEETMRGTPDELLAHFKDKEPRGEFVVVIAPKPEED